MKKKTRKGIKLTFVTRIPKKWRVIILLSATLIMITALTIVLAVNHVRAKTTIVAFYDISQETEQLIKPVITQDVFGKIKFLTLTENQSQNSALSKKIDILITPTSALTESKKKFALPLQDEIVSRYSRSIVNSPFFTKENQSSFCVMPIFMDHFEIAYYSVLLTKFNIQKPTNIEELISYAKTTQTQIASPVVCAGSDNETLYAFISVVLQSYVGSSYSDTLLKLAKANNFEELLSTEITTTNREQIKFENILKTFKEWQKTNVLIKNWYETKPKEITDYINKGRTSGVLMLLSEHRRQPFPMIKYFNAEVFPTSKNQSQSKTQATTGIIAPTVSAMHFRNTQTIRIMLNRLSSIAGQTEFSQTTHLAPATLRAESYDIQSDDVRFWSASYALGPLPTIDQIAFKTQSQRQSIATEIRKYLSE